MRGYRRLCVWVHPVLQDFVPVNHWAGGKVSVNCFFFFYLHCGKTCNCARFVAVFTVTGMSFVMCVPFHSYFCIHIFPLFQSMPWYIATLRCTLLGITLRLCTIISDKCLGVWVKWRVCLDERMRGEAALWSRCREWWQVLHHRPALNTLHLAQKITIKSTPLVLDKAICINLLLK